MCVCVCARVCVCACMCVFVCVCDSARAVCAHMHVCLRSQFIPPFGLVGMYIKKQFMQLVHVPLSSWHNSVLGAQLVKVCYYNFEEA